MRKDTVLVRGGRTHGSGPVNPPVVRASTITFATVAEFEEAQRRRLEPGRVYYGLYGTQTTFALEDALAQLEGAHRAIAVCSGLAATSATLLSLLDSGDHLLVPESVYGPVREFCDRVLTRLGIEPQYYDPLAGAAIAELVRPNTRLIYLESPGSLTFEVQDVPAIVAVAKTRGILTAIDNTWATPYFFSAFAHGVDISIQAVTKYIAGHSDLLLGSISTTQAIHERVRAGVTRLGYCAAPDDCYLALRGLRSLAARLERHQRSALRVAQWFAGRPEVRGVLYPALPGFAGYDLWQRDFSGATGLFSVLFPPLSAGQRAALIEGLEFFPIGASWGGYESLVMPARAPRLREFPGTIVRYHIGLEDSDDLIADLGAALERLRSAR